MKKEMTFEVTPVAIRLRRHPLRHKRRTAHKSRSRASIGTERQRSASTTKQNDALA
jgi:hypothetical protein